MISETTDTFAEIGAPANPFPGLRPFEFDESHLFFGRDGQSEQVISKLGRTRFLAVVGTSGSGKSSLVRAGLLPTLLGGFMTSAGSDWRIAIMRPGNDPVGNLAEALNAGDVFGSEIEENAAIQTAIAEATLRRGNLGLVDAVRQAVMPENENLLVVVDQFEEIFRFARVSEGDTYHNDAAAFVKLILEASRQREVPIYVVLTMRSDYLGDCSQFWDLPEAINESQYLIPRLTRDQLREAITGPAAVGLGRITPRLVNRLLNDVGDDQDQLPILQHALMRSWDEWRRGSHDHQTHKDEDALDLCCYQFIGGMAEALSRHADEAFNELPGDRSREVAGCLFKCLTEKGSDNREIRRPTTLGEICAVVGTTAAEAIVVIETFRQTGRSFLMPPAGVELNDKSLIDISHESLIRVWERLRQWVAEEARSARQYQRLAETAMLHEKGEAGLWRDPDLQLGLNWRDQNKPNAAWARRYHPGLSSALAGLDANQRQGEIENAFNQAMQFLDDSENHRAAEVDLHARQQQRELEQAQALAEEQKRRAEEAAKSASRLRRVVAAVIVLFLLALGAAGFALAQQRAAAAAEQSARFAEQSALEQKDIAEQKTKEADAAKQDALEKRAGLEIANVKAVKARQEAEGQATIAKQQKQKAETATAFSEHQRLEAEKAKTEAENQRQSAVQQQEIAQQNEKITRQLFYVANTNLVQRAYEENNFDRMKELLVANLPATGKPKDDLRGFEWYHFWHLNHKEPTTLKKHSNYVTAVAFSPDGKSIVAGGDKTVTIWDTGSLGEPVLLDVEEGLFHGVAFARGGALATLSGGTVRLWDAKGVKKAEFQVAHSSYPSLAISPDGELLAVAGGETVRMWDTAEKRELTPLQSPCNSVAFSPDGETLAVRDGETVKLFSKRTWKELPISPLKAQMTVQNAMAFSPDSKMLAVASGQIVKLWDTSTSTETLLERRGGLVLSVAFSPDGRTLALGNDNGTATLWDVSTRKEVPTSMRHSAYVFSVAFSVDGKTLATGSADQTVKLWDISWRQDQLPFAKYSSWGVLDSVAFSADGRLLASTETDNTVDLWDTQTRQRVATIKGHTKNVRSVAFSPDGEMLATGSDDATVKIWDIRHTDKLEKPIFTLNNERSVQFIAFSPDSKTLAIGVQYENLKLWDRDSGTLSPGLKGCGSAESAAFSSDGNMLAIGCNEGVKVWDLTTGKELPMPPESSHGKSLAFSPDGKALAIAELNDVKLWNIRKPQESVLLKGHSEGVSSIAFSPDGKTLASGGYDSTVRLWDVRTGQELATFKRDFAGDLSIVTSITFSRDGKMLAFGTMNGNLRLWYAATDKEVTAQRNK